MKTLRCADAGFKCDKVLRAQNEDELLKEASRHAREVHHVELTPQMAGQIRTLIREE